MKQALFCWFTDTGRTIKHTLLLSTRRIETGKANFFIATTKKQRPRRSVVADKTKTKSGGFKVQQQQQTDTSFYLVSLHCSHETLVRHFTYGTRFKCTDPGGLLRVVAFLNLLKPRSTDTGRGFCPRTGEGARTKKNPTASKRIERVAERVHSLHRE